MSTKVVINESPQYKLSVTDGTDQTLSVTNGIELQVTANVGEQGPAGPNEIITATETNLTGFIYGDGTNIGGAVEAVSAGVNYDAYYGKLVKYGDDDAFLWTPNTIAFGLGPQYTEDPQYSTLTGQYVGHSWVMPNASGTLSLEGHTHSASDITSGIGTAPTADTIALRNAFGGISANHIRLHSDTNYAQINPPTINSVDISFSLPHTGGTLTTTSTAVTLLGAQTVFGVKTFSGQMELTGQSAINSTSALTRGLGDSRYFPSFCDFLALPATANSVTLVTAAILTLNSGIYYFEAYAATYAPTGTPANTTIRLSSSDNANVGFYGSDDYGNTPLSHIDVEASTLPSAFIRQSSGAANTFSRRLTGILKVAFDETSLFLEFRQSATSGNIITCRSGAFMIARRISDYFIYT